MTVLALLIACTGSPGAPPPPEAPPAEVVDQAPEGHHKAHHASGDDDATVHHGFDDVERWVKAFDDPERDAWQKPEALVAALGVQPGQTVADIGAGTGYFNAHLARAVGESGHVIAVDIEENLVAHMSQRAEKEGTPQVAPRLGKPDDPGLTAAEADLVMMVDTYHHVNARVDYFSRLKAALKPGGRLVIVDFKPGDIPVGPEPEHRIPAEKVDAELGEAGYTLLEAPELLPYQFVRVYGVGS